VPVFTRRTPLDAPPAEVFAWHARPSTFARLNPPFDPVEIVSRSGRGLEVGTRLELRTHVGPAAVTWVAVHTACTPPSGFVDTQESGPFARWEHHHRFLPADPGPGSVLEDEVRWEAPLGAVGRALAPWVVEARLQRAFAYRHARTVNDLRRHRGATPAKIAITGATGLVGGELSSFLEGAGHEVVPVSRRAGLRWNPDAGEIDAAGFEGLDAVVHLAGESVGTGPWTDDRKEAILRSRTSSTELLCRTLAGLARKPKVLISASAVGFYGDGAELALDESAPGGEGFLADVCRAWEAPTRLAAEAGIRVVNLRIGLVVSAKGGFLKELLPLFRAGGGGPLGSGAQWQPWIHVDDLCAAVAFLLARDDLSGAVNAVGPNPARQGDLARALGHALGRPALVPAPRFAVRLALGRQKADELVFSSQRVLPGRLAAAGFRWDWPELGPALAFELGSAAT
jgi:uncharacterized protein (TIGR01777 family)